MQQRDGDALLMSASALPNPAGERMVRVLGSTWFLLLAVVATKGFATRVAAVSSLSESASLISSLCLAAFYAMLGVLILTRPKAKAQVSSALPKLAAFIGTYLPWCLTFTAARADHLVIGLLSSAFVLAGMIMMLVTIRYLGRSFSLVPQARSVVQTGPYRWIRHPLYLAEELAVIGVVIQYLSLLSLAILIGHIAVQVFRIHYEEDLLRRTLPEYSVYEAGRRRLIPHVW